MSWWTSVLVAPLGGPVRGSCSGDMRPLLNLKLCVATAGICTFSKQSHLQLTGASGQGFLAKLKNVYPRRLSAIHARQLIDASMRILSAAR